MIAIRSIFSTCNALCQGGLLTLHDVPPSICYPSGRRWQRRDPKPGEQRNLDLRIGRERASSQHDDCQHQGGRGPAVRGKVNPGEVLIKVVTGNKPKMLSGLNQKVRGQAPGASSSPVADVAPPADKHDLTPGSIEKVNEQPRCLPSRVGFLQRKPMGQRRRDEGGSECRSVVDRIEDESTHGTTFPHREAGLTSLRCSITREPWPTDSGKQADMSATAMLAGAAPKHTPDWHSIEWKKVWRTVRRLQRVS